MIERSTRSDCVRGGCSGWCYVDGVPAGFDRFQRNNELDWLLWNEFCVLTLEVQTSGMDHPWGTPRAWSDEWQDIHWFWRDGRPVSEVHASFAGVVKQGWRLRPLTALKLYDLLQSSGINSNPNRFLFCHNGLVRNKLTTASWGKTFFWQWTNPLTCLS